MVGGGGNGRVEAATVDENLLGDRFEKRFGCDGVFKLEEREF
jgi:hypothetical protein